MSIPILALLYATVMRESRAPSRLRDFERAFFSCSIASASCHVCALGVADQSLEGSTAVEIGSGDRGLYLVYF